MLKLTDKDESTITNALHTAAAQYQALAVDWRRDGGGGVGEFPPPVRERIAQQFERQAKDAESLAMQISEHGLTPEENPL